MKINFIVFFFNSFSNLDSCDIKNYFICVSVFRSEVNFGCLFLGLIHLFLEYQVSQWKPLSSLDWLAGESQQSRTRIQLSSPHHHIRDPGPDSTYLPHTTTPGIHAWDPPIQHILTLQRSRPRFYLSTTPGILAQILQYPPHTTAPGIHAWDPPIQHTPEHKNAFPGSNLLPSVCIFSYLCYIHAFIFSDYEDGCNFGITNLKFNHVSGIFKTSSVIK